MTLEEESLRDWHRLFGLLLMDFFSGSPFSVEVERDLSVQQQLLDMTIVRRGRGRFAGRLPDGLEHLRPHNLMSFKSRHEPLDAWAMKELVGADVAYRKLVSPSPKNRLPDEQFALYAVAARFPQNLSGQVPWQKVQEGVYNCRWGTDTIRVVVAGELPREAYNAPLHLFSASPELVEFGRGAYQRRSEQTSRLLGQLFEKLQGGALPCRSRWRTSTASTSRSTSRSSRRRSSGKHCKRYRRRSSRRCCRRYRQRGSWACYPRSRFGSIWTS